MCKHPAQKGTDKGWDCLKCGKIIGWYWLTIFWNVLNVIELELAKVDINPGNAFAAAMLWIKRILKSRQKQ